MSVGYSTCIRISLFLSLVFSLNFCRLDDSRIVFVIALTRDPLSVEPQLLQVRAVFIFLLILCFPLLHFLTHSLSFHSSSSVIAVSLCRFR